MTRILIFLLLCSLVICNQSCKKKIKVTEDSIYSRHLQKHVKLRILLTPNTDDKNLYNLLLLNDGKDMDQLRVQKIVDSLYEKKKIRPLIVVAIYNGDRMQEYGVAGFPDYNNNGSDAKKYSAFVDDELYPFIKKKVG
ncbi:MAG: alpha/beta hydrolase-fold protein [Ginsengibacter sp.]